MKKKILALVVLVVLIIGGVAIYALTQNQENSTEGENTVNVNEPETNQTQDEVNTENGVEENIAQSEVTDNERNLVLYFSGTNNTEKFAQIINDLVGGDIKEIEPAVPYADNYADIRVRAREEEDNNTKVEMKSMDLDLEDYDTIFIGYPIWFGKMPRVMDTFFEEYDFSGKTIVPFNTHEGSGASGTYTTIKQLEPNAEVLEGLPITGSNMDRDQTNTITSWLNKIEIKLK